MGNTGNYLGLVKKINYLNSLLIGSYVFFQGPLVGMNPVQIRATVDLYPRSRPSLSGGIRLPEAPAGWCLLSVNVIHTNLQTRLHILRNTSCMLCHMGFAALCPIRVKNVL